MAATLTEKDKGLGKFLKNFKGLGSWRVTVGVQGQQASEIHSGNITNADLAAVHEFGAPSVSIPQRSYLRSTADNDKNRWNRRLTEELKKVALESADPRKALTIVGEEFRAAVIDRIKAGIPPPLVPATIARKGESTPLIDTGALIGAITSYVSQEKK